MRWRSWKLVCVGCVLCGAASLEDELSSLAPALEDCDGNCAASFAQLRGELRSVEEATLEETASRDLSEGGVVKCLCKDAQNKYFCAKSFEGLSKCHAPCPSLCSAKGGHFFMCGGAHENLWLDRYFKKEERHHAKCPKH
mmetsp:Transcript_34635/g.64517  ORF Transcript_34635/g.64517 Transcript_34635/m.64517 type:complete len:140 (-) Transcript_34635:154-573(-)